LRICEQLGEEPDPEKMPPDLTDFPVEVQVAFFIFDLLEDRWEGMSGTYMGKYWSNINTLFDLYEIEDRRIVFYIMKIYEGLIIKERAEKAEQKRKAEERKTSAGGGKQYTHNVKG
jgi:hypothetical protein